jgi:hypothetical protein
MPTYLTEDEWRRIRKFANASTYERDPDLLLPDRRSEESS